MDDDANIQIKKGMRKSKKDPQPPPPEPTEETAHDQEDQQEDTPAVEVPATKPKKSAKKSAPKVETQDYEVEQQPDVVIHKRHKGAKPRKVIVITADSDANTSDEELPYRARPQVQVKPRPKVSAPASAGAGDPKPAKPKATKPPVVPVQKVSQKPNADVGAGLPERYAMSQKPKQGYVVDEFIDKLLGLS